MAITMGSAQSHKPKARMLMNSVAASAVQGQCECPLDIHLQTLMSVEPHLVKESDKCCIWKCIALYQLL